MPINFPQKPGLIAYLTAGDPDLATTVDIALALLSTTEPTCSSSVSPSPIPSPTAPSSSAPASAPSSAEPPSPRSSPSAPKSAQPRPAAGIILFSYLNPVVRLGLPNFCQQAADSGADGVLLTDMIVEEASEYLAEMQRNTLAPVFLAAPTSSRRPPPPPSPSTPQGFVYAISRVGVTGTQTAALTDDAQTLVARLRQFTQTPIAVGFGISNRAHVEAVGQFADAAIIGSAIVALIEQTTPAEAPAAVGHFLRSLRP